MKLILKQRIFTWLDSYDIYDEESVVQYHVKSQLSWGHKLKVFDAQNNHVATLKEEVLTFLPKFIIYINDDYIGCLKKEFSLFKPKFQLDCYGWTITGNWLGWDYQIINQHNMSIAFISKEIFNFSDTYIIDIVDEQNTLKALMIVLAIDAEKCSSND